MFCIVIVVDILLTQTYIWIRKVKKYGILLKKNHQYLSSGGHVELLDDVVEEGDGYNDDDKDRHGKDNSHHGAEHRQQLIEQLAHVHRHGRVDNVDVLGETVQNAAYQ